MSRHRNVKQLVEDDYYDDCDDDYDDDDCYEDYGARGSSQNQPKKKQSAVKVPSKQPQQSKKQQPSTTKSSHNPPQGLPNSTPAVSSPPGFSSKDLNKKISSERTTTNVPPAKVAALIITPQTREPPPIPAILLQQQTDNSSHKIPMTVIVVGHVDAGKSTITGRLLYGMGTTSTNRRKNGNPPINFAWLLDEDEQERLHGVTMDIATKQMETNKFQIVLQDAPGHADYVPAMITGTSSADAVLLTVDAIDLHTALHSGGQLREHVYLARGLGVSQILVVVNKIDLIGWDNEVQYEALQAELQTFLVKQVGYPPSKVRFVPVSGLTGTNIFPTPSGEKISDETLALKSWYKGPTLLEALDQFDPPVQQQQIKILKKPVRIVVSDVFDSSGSGVVVRAKVVAGWVKQGESVVVFPVGDETVLTKVSSLHITATSTSPLSERRQYCVAGELFDCVLSNLDAQRVSRGSILARPQMGPPLASRCRAKIFVLDSITIPLIRGAQVIFHMHHLDVPCNLTVLLRTIKPDGTSVLKERPRSLSKACTAIVELQLSLPICMEAFSDCRALGRFVLRRNGDSIAVGRIEEILT